MVTLLTFADILKNLTPVAVTFVVSEVIVAILLQEQRSDVITIGMILAFLSIVAVLVASMVADKIGIASIQMVNVLKFGVPIVAVFSLSSAVLVLVPEAERGILVILGLVLGFLSLIGILIAALYINKP
jgi:hypothetical protein